VMSTVYRARSLLWFPEPRADHAGQQLAFELLRWS
jgi:hypothetical protein